MANINFNADAVDISERSFDPIPAGTYVCQVVSTELRALKSGNGDGLSVSYEVLEGQFANRRLWQNLNIKHTNEVAQRIGQEQLAKLCKAVGVSQLTDTTQLHMKPIKVRVKIRKDDQYGDKNEVADVAAIAGSRPVAAQPAPQKPAAPVAPWATQAA